MKKTKILIPALSIASVGAVVVPMVTSCNSSFMTITDGNFKGEVHAEVKEENAWSQIKASEEYFKDKKYLAEDFATYTIQSVQTMGKAQFEDFTIENLKLEPVIKINNLTIGKELVAYGESVYMISGSTDAKIKFSFDAKPKESAHPYEKVHLEIDAIENFAFNDCIAMLEYKKDDEEWNWEASFYGYLRASTKWSSSINATYDMTATTTLKAGGTKVTKDAGTQIETHSAMTEDPSEPTPLGLTFVSNYLSKVAGPKE